MRILTQSRPHSAPRPLLTAADPPGAARLAPRGRVCAQEPSAWPAALLDAARYAVGRPLRRAGRQDQPALAAASQGQACCWPMTFVAPALKFCARISSEWARRTPSSRTRQSPAWLAVAMPGQFDRVLVDVHSAGRGHVPQGGRVVAAQAHNNAFSGALCGAGGKFSKTRRRCWLRAACSSTRPAHLPRRRTRNRIAAFLAKHPAFTLCDLSGCGFGARASQPRPDYRISRRIHTPHLAADGGEGHFMAKLQKAADADAPYPPKGKPPGLC